MRCHDQQRPGAAGRPEPPPRPASCRGPAPRRWRPPAQEAPQPPCQGRELERALPQRSVPAAPARDPGHRRAPGPGPPRRFRCPRRASSSASSMAAVSEPRRWLWATTWSTRIGGVCTAAGRTGAARSWSTSGRRPYLVARVGPCAGGQGERSERRGLTSQRGWGDLRGGGLGHTRTGAGGRSAEHCRLGGGRGAGARAIVGGDPRRGLHAGRSPPARVGPGPKQPDGTQASAGGCRRWPRRPPRTSSTGG